MSILNNDPPPLLRSYGGASVLVAARRSVLFPAIGVTLCTLAIAAAQPVARAAAADVTPVPAVAQSTAARPVVAVRPKPGQFPAVWLNAAQPQAGAGSACWQDLPRSNSFWGTTSTRDVAGRTVISEQVGFNGADRVIQKSLGDVRLCMVAEGLGPRVNDERPSHWPGRARRVVLEASRGRDVQRLELIREGGGQRASWQVGGTVRPFDATAEQWRDLMLAALDTTWAIATLRGEVSTLRGEISTIRGEESTLRGEISTLQGEISTMRGRQSTIRGEESTLRGEISSIRGHVSSLRGAISSEQGRISSLSAGGYRSDDKSVRDLISRSEREIARLEVELRAYGADARIAAVAREILALDVDTKVALVESEIRKFELDAKRTAIERRIAALDVAGKIAAIERQIAALDADRRQAELEKRRDEELKRFEAAIAAIR